MWAAPDAFIFQGVLHHVLQNKLHWQAAVADMRLVNRAWRRGASEALPLLCPRSWPEDQLPRLAQFCNVKVLSMQPSSRDGEAEDAGPGSSPDLADAALTQVAAALPRLRALQLSAGHRGFRATGWALSPRGLEALGRLHHLGSLVLEAPWEVCRAAAQPVARLPQLRRLALLPVRGARAGPRPRALLPLLTGLTGLHALACSTHKATPADLAALSALSALSHLELREFEEATAPALAELAGTTLRTLRSLSVSGFMQYHFLPRYCTRLPAEAFSSLTHLEAPWLLLLATILPAPRATAPVPGALAQLTSLEVDMEPECYNDDEGDEDEGATQEYEARWQLLPEWIFSQTRLRRLRLHGAMGGCGPNIWEESMAEGVSRLQALTRLELTRSEMEAGVIQRGIAGISGLRDLKLGVDEEECWAAVPQLSRLQGLTHLELLCGGRASAETLVQAVSQLTSLRSLQLVEWSHSALGPGPLQAILSALPSLELLQTSWGPDGSDTEQADFCARNRGRLQHSLGVVGERDTRAAFDAGQALGLLDQL